MLRTLTILALAAISSTATADSSLPRGANAAVPGNFAESCRARFQEARWSAASANPDLAMDTVMVTIDTVNDPRGRTMLFLSHPNGTQPPDLAEITVVGKNVAPKMTREGLLAKWTEEPAKIANAPKANWVLQLDGSFRGTIQVQEGMTPRGKAFVEAFRDAIDRCLGREVVSAQRR